MSRVHCIFLIFMYQNDCKMTWKQCFCHFLSYPQMSVQFPFLPPIAWNFRQLPFQIRKEIRTLHPALLTSPGLQPLLSPRRHSIYKAITYFINLSGIPKVAENTPKINLCEQRTERNPHLKSKTTILSIIRNTFNNSGRYKV